MLVAVTSAKLTHPYIAFGAFLGATSFATDADRSPCRRRRASGERGRGPVGGLHADAQHAAPILRLRLRRWASCADRPDAAAAAGSYATSRVGRAVRRPLAAGGLRPHRLLRRRLRALRTLGLLDSSSSSRSGAARFRHEVAGRTGFAGSGALAPLSYELAHGRAVVRPRSPSGALANNGVVGGVSDADFALPRNRLSPASRHWGQRPLPQRFLGQGPWEDGSCRRLG
jgi:hypothetical protein